MKTLIFILLIPALLSASSFTIQGNSDICDVTYIYERSATPDPQLYNFGEDVKFIVGDNWAGSDRDYHALIHFPTLADTMIQLDADSGTITWDSANLGIVIIDTSDFFDDSDSIYIMARKLLVGWEEGQGTGQDTCGACWDSANADGYTGCAGDATDWNTDGAEGSGTDYSATIESDDSILLAGPVLTEYDTVYVRLTTATVTDSLGEGIKLHYMRGFGDNIRKIYFGSDDNATAANRPFLTVWYTTTGSAPTSRKVPVTH